MCRNSFCYCFCGRSAETNTDRCGNKTFSDNGPMSCRDAPPCRLYVAKQEGALKHQQPKIAAAIKQLGKARHRGATNTPRQNQGHNENHHRTVGLQRKGTRSIDRQHPRRSRDVVSRTCARQSRLCKGLMQLGFLHLSITMLSHCWSVYQSKNQAAAFDSGFPLEAAFFLSMLSQCIPVSMTSI